jgi:hypothetical protein
MARVLPPGILAIDWGATGPRRQVCAASLRGGRYTVHPPVALADPAALELPPGVLAAFDCVLGLPAGYASLAGFASFRDALHLLGEAPFERFFEPAAAPGEIGVGRPFYPARPGGASRTDLERALGPAAFELRACDRATGAGPLFWLVGAKQVGRSSLAVWRDVLQPRLDDVALWPFDGPLERLLAAKKPVVAEMYPAFLLRTLGVEITSKRDGLARRRAGAQLVERVKLVDLAPVRSLLLDGFGPSGAGEDAFDATVSAIALAHLLAVGGVPEPPDDARRVEGWILGL